MPKPGDYGVTATAGNWRDRIISTLIRWDTSSPVNHAFVVQKRWFHGRLGTNWVWRRIATRVSGDGTMICSQLVDNAYETAGVHLFTDGRPQGSVSPGDLYRLIYGATL